MNCFRASCLVVCLVFPFAARAQDHGHSYPPQDAATHDKFYATWYMPDNPVQALAAVQAQKNWWTSYYSCIRAIGTAHGPLSPRGLISIVAEHKDAKGG
jgi:hypothetical protein